MALTKIEWADKVWNPITGCTPISEGCAHCYAKRMAHRLKGRYGYPKDDPFRVTFHPDRLEEPLRWKKPSRIFVVSMGDLFHENVPESSIRDVFEIMRSGSTGEYCRNHTYMVLTKRPERMQHFIMNLRADRGPDFVRWPLPFVWLGITAETQLTYNLRILSLLKIPAKKYFISVEPMLEPIDLFLDGQLPKDYEPNYLNGQLCQKISWVICGAETGPGARPMNLEWARDLRDQCKASGVPFFFKKASLDVETPKDLMIREFPVA